MVLMLYRASVVNHCVQFHSSELDDLSPMLPNELRSSAPYQEKPKKLTKLFLGRYAQNLSKSISIIVSLARLARQESYKPDGVFQRSEVFPWERLAARSDAMGCVEVLVWMLAYKQEHTHMTSRRSPTFHKGFLRFLFLINQINQEIIVVWSSARHDKKGSGIFAALVVFPWDCGDNWQVPSLPRCGHDS